MKLGIIGAGNMGFAIVRGLLKSGAVSASEVAVSDVDKANLARVAELGVDTTGDNKKVADRSDVVILAVKPNIVEKVLLEISPDLSGKLLVSIAAGVSTSFLERLSSARIVRLMPNLCAEVGEMAGCYSLGSRAGGEDERIVKTLFGRIGKIFKIDERLMDAVTALSGSGPAFFFHFIRSATEAGTELGLSTEIAGALAAQTARGAATMVLEGADSGELIGRVCTPGGTTIEGMKILESEKVAQAIKKAIKGAAKRASELSR